MPVRALSTVSVPSQCLVSIGSSRAGPCLLPGQILGCRAGTLLKSCLLGYLVPVLSFP